jgi:hypothetical protein
MSILLVGREAEKAVLDDLRWATGKAGRPVGAETTSP